MCVTIYGSNRDLRIDMQRKNGSARAHAICRKLIACAKQKSPWYGAHYWAGCAVTTDDSELTRNLVWYRLRWICEAESKGISHKAAILLWDIAITRCLEIREEAMNLKTSLLW